MFMPKELQLAEYNVQSAAQADQSFLKLIGQNFQKPKSLQVVSWRDLEADDSGGSEIHAHEIVSRWVQKGINVNFRTAKVKGMAKNITRSGYNLERVGGRYLSFARSISAGLVGQLSRCDALVEIWNGMPFLSPIWSRVPRVVILHHIHGKSYFRAVLPGPLACGAAFFESKIAPRLYRNTRVITPSQSSAKELIEIMGWPEDLVSVIYPGINEKFSPGLTKSDIPLVLAVGRLVPVKRFDDLIDIVGEIRSRKGDINLVIAGDGPCRQALEEKIKRLNATSWCKLEGKVSDERLIELYRTAWVVVSNSEKEGWGMTLTEAAACGTPAVATRISGHMDAVIHGYSGLLSANRNDFVVNLELLLLDNDLRARLAKGALEYARSMTWDNTASQILTVINYAIAEHRADKHTYARDLKKPAKSFNKRGWERIITHLTCHGTTFKGVVKDLSRSGAYVQCDNLDAIRIGSFVNVKVETEANIYILDGHVVRLENGRGFAIRFAQDTHIAGLLWDEVSRHV
jgi:glycosyltransferase involved in cell wall biosynthesis